MLGEEQATPTQRVKENEESCKYVPKKRPRAPVAHAVILAI
jgi:hypothetical protein